MRSVAQEPRNLGEITYGDERIREGIYDVRVFPLSLDFLGVLSKTSPTKGDRNARYARAKSVFVC